MSAWNVGEIEQMALPPCHAFFQFYVADGKLSCQLYQRSADIFLGVPFNIASYALLTMMMAQVCDLEVGDFVHTLGDAHIYTNHFEQTELQFSRDCKKLPTMKINPEVKSIFDFTIDDFELVNYESSPSHKRESSCIMANIIVLGAGLVGGVMATDLSKQHEVTSVDISQKNLDKLKLA